MKKLKLLMLLFTAVSVGFTGCKKDDGDDANANIVGKWSLTKEVSREYNSAGVLLHEDTEISNDNAWVLEFKSDGTYKGYDEGVLDEEGTYSIQNDGKTLVLNSKHDDEDQTVTISSLTSSEIIIYFEYTETEGNQTVKSTYEETYRKL